jgi:hypothetical protein
MLQSYKNKTIVSKKKFSSGRIILPKILFFSVFLFTFLQSMEYVVAPVIGATVKPYMSQVLASAHTWATNYPKTFDNEFNEAVCGIKRDKLEQLMAQSLGEFEKQVNACREIVGNNTSIDFSLSIFESLAQSALMQLQKYELALLTLDFVEQAKIVLDDKIEELSKTLTTSYDPRRVGGNNAQELEEARSKNVKEAQEIIRILKMNLCRALYDKYQYDCEGGVLDRLGRSFGRHHERKNFWGLVPNIWGKVPVPLWCNMVNSFPEDNLSVGAQVVRKCKAVYGPSVDLIRARLETQIGLDNLDYVARLKDQFKVLFPGKKFRSTDDLDKPQFLLDYIEFLKRQHAEKQKS